MASSLSNLVDNFSGMIHEIKCKYRHDNKKCGKCGIKYKNCECYLENTILKYTNVKGYLMVCRCFCCNRNFEKLDEDLKK